MATLLERLLTPKGQSTAGFVLGEDIDIAAHLRERYGDFGDLLALYARHSGAMVHKFHHYLPIYERYFSPFRGRPVKFLEIGVSKGGSLELWRRYFGPDAVIFGIDIDPACAQFDGQAASVRIGSQDDPEFLNRVVDEMGGLDVVLDDGSHQMDHLRTSLLTLFPRLSVNGLYMVEDLQTAFWRRFGGGYRARKNFFNAVRQITDDMHHWYHDQPVGLPQLKDVVTGIHVHEAIVVIDKGIVHRPTQSWVGEGSPFNQGVIGGEKTNAKDEAEDV
jgi:hypothetical protein